MKSSRTKMRNKGVVLPSEWEIEGQQKASIETKCFPQGLGYRHSECWLDACQKESYWTSSICLIMGEFICIHMVHYIFLSTAVYIRLAVLFCDCPLWGVLYWFTSILYRLGSTESECIRDETKYVLARLKRPYRNKSALNNQSVLEWLSLYTWYLLR